VGYRGEWRVVGGEGVGQWGGQAAIMMFAGDEGVWRRAGAKDCCRGQAAMVLADHVNSWWGVELLIPLLKPTKRYYFSELSM